jgi:ribosomal protein L7/L12
LENVPQDNRWSKYPDERGYQKKGALHMSNYDNEIFELRQRIVKLENQIAFILQQQGLNYHEEENMGVSPEIINLMREGKKIQAIKLSRQETGAGLKQAKEFVDSLEV